MLHRPIQKVDELLFASWPLCVYVIWCDGRERFWFRFFKLMIFFNQLQNREEKKKFGPWRRFILRSSFFFCFQRDVEFGIERYLPSHEHYGIMRTRSFYCRSWFHWMAFVISKSKLLYYYVKKDKNYLYKNSFECFRIDF